MSWIYVFLGGGLGAIARYLIARTIRWEAGSFPWATFSANVLSCLIIGFFIGHFLQKGDSDYRLELFLLVGFCGGFSTFSSFTAENLKLLQSGNYTIAFIYILLSIFLCLAAILAGIKIYPWK